ncbi:alpha/beta hydrolase [Paenarthrobacter sp. S56]|uniref:alpha/beta fold hydrolase n=1 Tax=Paenarthrobacter sp. S56 TaxID=3138179 RepID=UPI00321B3B79
MSDAAVTPCFVEVRRPGGDDVDQPPAVLIHGWASGSSYWEPLADRLCGAGHTVWIVDLPGYHPGEELPAGFDWTLDSAAASVAAAIEGHGTPRVHLVGHSMGGSISLALAAARPGLVASVTLVGMVPAPPNKGFKAMLLQQVEQGYFDAATIRKCMDAWYGELPAGDRERLSKGFDVPFGVLAPSALAAMTGVERSVPRRVTAPLLVIAGTGDRVRSIAQMESFVEAAPGRQLKAVPNAGHSVHWEQPDVCASTLREFWRTSGATPA